MARVFSEERPDAVLNLAAETHVDRSIDGPARSSTRTSSARSCCSRRRGSSSPRRAGRARAVSLPARVDRRGLRHARASGLFTEETPYAPNSPYAASKASADHLVRAYYHTYGLPVLITNCSNNYGPYQFPEKLIPLMILNALEGRPLPIYGDGGNVRDWLHVEDHCAGILLVLGRDAPGEKYNIGGGSERTNLQVVDAMCDALERCGPLPTNPALAKPGGRLRATSRRFVPIGPVTTGVTPSTPAKIGASSDGQPRHPFEDGLEARPGGMSNIRTGATRYRPAATIASDSGSGSVKGDTQTPFATKARNRRRRHLVLFSCLRVFVAAFARYAMRGHHSRRRPAAVGANPHRCCDVMEVLPVGVDEAQDGDLKRQVCNSVTARRRRARRPSKSLVL